MGVPDDLESIGQYVTLVRGRTYSGTLVGKPGPALLGLGSIRPGGGFRHKGYKTYGGECPPGIMLEPGDIFVSLKGATKDGEMIGSVARVPLSVSSGRLTQDTVKLVFNERTTNQRSFLYWVLRTPQYRAYCAGRATGSAVVALSRRDFLSFPVPPFTRLRQLLAGVLDSIELKIELNRQMSETLEQIGRAFLQQWLEQQADAVQYQPLGALVAVLETGKRPKGGVKNVVNGVPSVGAESITGIGRFDFSKTKYVPEEFFESLNRGVVADFDVLLYKDGGRPGLFEPHVSMAGQGFPFHRFCINEHVYRMRISPPHTQALLYYWLDSLTAREEMRTKGTGVAIPGLNSAAVRSLSFPVARAEAIRVFNAIAEPVTSRILLAARESRTLELLRDALLPTLISGELRIPEAERLVSEVA